MEPRVHRHERAARPDRVRSGGLHPHRLTLAQEGPRHGTAGHSGKAIEQHLGVGDWRHCHRAHHMGALGALRSRRG